MFLAAGAAVNYTIPQKIAAVRKTLAESISVEFIHRPDAEAKCTWKSCPFQQRSFKLDLWLRIQFSSFSCPSSPTLTAGRCMVEMSFSLLSLFSTPSLHPQRWQVSTLNHSVLVSDNRIPPPPHPPMFFWINSTFTRWTSSPCFCCFKVGQFYSLSAEWRSSSSSLHPSISGNDTFIWICGFGHLKTAITVYFI